MLGLVVLMIGCFDDWSMRERKKIERKPFRGNFFLNTITPICIYNHTKISSYIFINYIPPLSLSFISKGRGGGNCCGEAQK